MRKKTHIPPHDIDPKLTAIDSCVKKNNPTYEELETIGQLLDEMPQLVDLIEADLCQAKHSSLGRQASVSCEQVLRCAILKQLKDYDYRELADQIDITPIYRKFTRFYTDPIPDYSTLDRLIKALRAQTIMQINSEILKLGVKKNVEDAKAIRQDSNVTETNIRYPADCHLLNDTVRVLTRQMRQIREHFGAVLDVEFHDHTRRAKKRAYQISIAKGKNVEQRRAALYKDLLAVQQQVVAMACAFEQCLAKQSLSSKLVEQFKEMIGLARQVHNQAEQRVIEGQKVPADEKLVSVFETHSDIIRRGKSDRPTEFGHKVDYCVGKSAMVTHYEVLRGNPNDNEALVRCLKEHEKIFGGLPQKVATDHNYYSQENEQTIKAMGVKYVAMPKKGLIDEMRRRHEHQPWFRRLLRWRVGIEGCLSTLLRCFGLSRCLWKGWPSFQSYVGLSVMAYNLRILASHVCQS